MVEFLISIVVIVLVVLALSGLRIVQQYERGVVFVLGRLIGAKGQTFLDTSLHLAYDKS